MTIYKLITTTPLALARSAVNGFPTSYKLPDGGSLPVPPDGYAYVPQLDYPTDPASDGNTWARELTATEYGWQEVTAPEPEWYEIPAWRIRAIADVTPHGGGLLIDSVSAAIDAIVDPLEKSVAKEVFFGGNTLRRDSTLLVTMAAGLGLSDAELDDLFQQAFSIEV